jgi:hypothetical protein
MFLFSLYKQGSASKEAEFDGKMAVFWVVELRSLVEVYGHFGGTCCLHLQTALLIKAADTSGTLANFCQITHHYNPENSHLHSRCSENSKSY